MTADLALWERFRDGLLLFPQLGLRLDLSRMDLDEAWVASMSKAAARAFSEMEALEGGAIANADEKRRVGHYWLRDSKRAPEGALMNAIDTTVTLCSGPTSTRGSRASRRARVWTGRCVPPT